jgi:ubiquitin carboxyl-terminal hydrolase 47
VLNSSVEMALENYIKPEVLSGDNAYFCEMCSKKVTADRGIKLVRGPKILTIVLNRFTLDYSTFQRVKLQDRVSFPSTINLNDYLNGYDGIKNKKYAQEVERMQKYKADAIKRNIQ